MAIDKVDRVVLSESVRNEIDSKATKTELNEAKVDLENQIAAVVSGTDWKESVATYADIATTYPSPIDGWTVNVIDTDITYRYDGSNWIAISANSIPLASTNVDGKMSKEDKTKLDTVESGAEVNLTSSEMLEALKTVDTNDSGLNANTLQGKTASEFAVVDHTHDGRYYTETEVNTLLNGKSNAGHTHTTSNITDFVSGVRGAVLTGLSTATNAVITATDTVLSAFGKLQKQISDNLSSFTAHDNDTDKHISSTERTNWNDANSKKHEHDNKTILDGITQGTIDTWDTVANKSDKTYVDEQLANKANLASPAFSGAPTAPTAETGTSTEQLATTAFVQGALSTGGYGDMLKANYDSNNDGIVNQAEEANSVPWSGVTGKPTITDNNVQLGNYNLIFNPDTNSLDIEVTET